MRWRKQMQIKETRPTGLTKENVKRLIVAIQAMEDELDEVLTEKFADLEMGLDDIGIKRNPFIFKIFDRASDYQFKMASDLKLLRKTLSRIINKKV